MANDREQQKSTGTAKDQESDSVRIDDIAEDVDTAESDSIKGGLRPRSGGAMTDEDADEVGE